MLNIAQSLQVWLGEDSGKVTQLSFNTDTIKLIDTQTVYVSQITFPAHSSSFCLQQFINESVLSVNIDILRMPGSDSWTTALSLGSNTKVVVLERSTMDQPFSQIEEINNPEAVSDNVSCL